MGASNRVSVVQALGVRLSFYVSYESKLIFSPLSDRDPLSSRTSISVKPAETFNRSEMGSLLYFGAIGRGENRFRVSVSKL
jgi:hypothetical protein